MHKEILTEAQAKLLPLVKQFSRNFYLVGGTAIALHLGHRRSIDYDLFTNKEFENNQIIKKIRKFHFIHNMIRNELDQLTLDINDVKFTFFNFPYSVNHKVKFKEFLTMPDLLTLAGMKAFALGQRPKWKDYVDLYFILQRYKITEVIDQAA